ncbi:MAG: nucleotidyltransferase family protein [Bacteroidia bacterium]
MRLHYTKKRKIVTFFESQPVLKAYLFGSYSRGEATPASDIDLLVELDYSKMIGLEFIQMQLDLEKLLGKKVDVVSARGLSKYVEPLINKDKKLIYERQTGR